MTRTFSNCKKRRILSKKKRKNCAESLLTEDAGKFQNLSGNVSCDDFKDLTYDPYDIKAMMHSVDFIVFDGMNAKDMKSVTLLSRRPSDKIQSKVLASIGKSN